MRYLIVVVLLLLPLKTFAVTCSSTITQGSTESCDTIIKDSVTWTFPSAQTVGQFITGDYFVVVPTGTLAVSIDPAPNADRNGSMVNPLNDQQALDSRGYDYNATLLFSSGDVISAGDSLISTKSDDDPDDDMDVIGTIQADEHSWVEAASVLTCLSSQPSANSFRPAAFGTDKTIYDYDDADLSVLASVPVSTADMSYRPDLGSTYGENLANFFSRPWLNWFDGWVGRYMHPMDNMPNYYEYAYDIYSEAGLYINSDASDKEDVLIGIIQLGIETYYATNGRDSADRTVSKFNMLVAGMVLGEPQLYTSVYPFYEIKKTYTGSGWTGATALFRDSEGKEYEHADPDIWTTMYTESWPDMGAFKEENYRRCCTSVSWSGLALGVRMMEAEIQWDHDPFLDYMDRWWDEAGPEDDANQAYMATHYTGADTWGDSGSTTSAFVTDMWETYRGDYSGLPITELFTTDGSLILP